MKKIARYKIIENDILKKIELNEYNENELIPTEAMLSEMYGVSRLTVRKATDNLVFKGYLKRTPGLGTVVTMPQKTQSKPSISGFTDHIHSLGKTPSSVIEKFVIIEANEQHAQILSVNQGDRLYYIERLRKADNDVCILEISYISVDYFPELSVSYLENSKFDFFQNVKQLSIDYQFHTVHPVLSDERISEFFDIDFNTPIILVENKIIDSNGRVIDYSKNFYNTTKYELNYIKR